jgi:hypothetical protein
MNLACKPVFGQWISQKLRDLALIGYSLTAIGMVTIGIAIYMWRKLANGIQKILWHSRPVEGLILGITLGTVIVLGAIIGKYRPAPPTIYPYAAQSPNDLILTEVNLNSVRLKSDLLTPNKASFTVYGLQISEDQS